MAMMKREEPAESDSLRIGPGTAFEGKLTFKGPGRIDGGKFVGSITANDTLTVEGNAKIDAEISCGTLVIHGELNGNITAKSAVELHYPAKVRGNITTPSLVVEKGVIVRGELKMNVVEDGAARSASGGK